MTQNDENIINPSEYSDLEIEETDLEILDKGELMRSITFNILNEMEERQHRSIEFLNGRNPHDLSDEEFDKLQEISGNNYFDKRNPEHVKIIENRRIFNEREEYLKIHNDRTEIDQNFDEDRWFGLNLHSILKSVNSIGIIASKYDSDNFYFKLLSDLVFIHDSRKLNFHIEDAKAIADPDESIMSDQFMNSRGVVIYGQFAYDLNLEVTLDKREYEDMHLRDAFCFFFALRLSQIDIMHTTTFLDYQLSVTFEGDFARFKSFLLPLCIKYKIIELNAFGRENKEILTAEVVELVKDWIDFQKQKPILANNSSIIPIVELDEIKELKEIDIGSIGIEKIYGKLSPKKIEQFLGLLGDLRNKKGNTLLESKDVKALQKIGLNFPTSENYQKFELNITNHDKRVVYYYFHIFWTIHSDALNDGRELFAKYIKTYFTNFSDTKIPTLIQSLRAHEVSTYNKSLISERVKLMNNS